MTQFQNNEISVINYVKKLHIWHFQSQIQIISILVIEY